MSLLTDMLGLVKPDETEYVDIDTFNDNMDKIDANVGASSITIARGNADQAVASFGTEDWNLTNSSLEAGSLIPITCDFTHNSFIIPVTGVYEFGVYAQWDGFGDGTRRVILADYSTGDYIREWAQMGAAQVCSVNGAVKKRCVAGQEFKLVLSNTDTTTARNLNYDAVNESLQSYAWCMLVRF